MDRRRCIIGQSGGPTVAINATLAGVIKAARQNGFDAIYGMVNGIQGFLENQMIDLIPLCTEEKMEQLIHTPAMYLGSCRFKIADNDVETKNKIFENLERIHITDVFYIGGNDSMDTVQKLSAHAAVTGSPIRFIGIPKTIDNDLEHAYYIPGYPSACQYVATTMLEIAHDAAIYPGHSVTIVEIMGRDAGWLAASASLVNQDGDQMVDLIYLPEVSFHMEDFISRVKTLLLEKQHIIVAVSEGIRDNAGQYIASPTGYVKDAFGNCSRSGCAAQLKQRLETAVNCKIRSIELNVLQRNAGHLANEYDLQNAVRIGETAVQYAMELETGIFVGSRYDAEYGLLFTKENISEVSNKVRAFPGEWIDRDQCQIKNDYIDYVRVLLAEDGMIHLPEYLRRES